jgi:hypothetical protein
LAARIKNDLRREVVRVWRMRGLNLKEGRRVMKFIIEEAVTMVRGIRL